MKRALMGLALAAAAVGCGSRQTAPVAWTGGDAERGRAALRRYGCDACHLIPGVRGADGLVGPSLERSRERRHPCLRFAGIPNGSSYESVNDRATISSN